MRAIGAKNTHFVNPHGLHAPKHLSTAYDMAVIAKTVMENPQFREIVGQRAYVLERSHNKEDSLVETRAKFLNLYEGAEGIKTGYTRQAGYCFVGSATRNGRRLIAVVLNSPQREQDTIALMDYGFEHWEPLVLARAGIERLGLDDDTVVERRRQEQRGRGHTGGAAHGTERHDLHRPSRTRRSPPASAAAATASAYA